MTKKAFTLLEIMLVITIMALIMVVSISSLGLGRTKNNLKTSQREVTSAIRLAQSYALQGKLAPEGKAPCGFGFRFKDAGSYEIFYILPSGSCDETNPTYTSGDRKSLESLDLKNGIALQGDLATAEIYFTVPHANAFGTSGANFSKKEIILKSPSGEETKKIIVSSSGEITEE